MGLKGDPRRRPDKGLLFINGMVRNPPYIKIYQIVLLNYFVIKNQGEKNYKISG